MVLSAISGILDPKDPYTFKKSIDFISVLKPDALKGARIGVPRNIMNGEYNRPDRPENKNIFPEIFAAFNESLRLMKELGATIVDPVYFETYKEMVVTKHSDKNKKYVLGVDLKVRVINAHNSPFSILCLIRYNVDRDGKLFEKWNASNKGSQFVANHRVHQVGPERETRPTDSI